MNKTQAAAAGPRAIALQKYTSARQNLLLMIALTALNAIILAFGSNTMLLFSATVPYLAVVYGVVSESTPFLIACIFAAVGMLTAYFLCWLLSKKHYGWMIAAMVMFIIDTAVMVLHYLLIGDFSGILDVIIHVWVLYYLILGVRYGYQLKTLPEDPVAEPVAEAAEAAEMPATPVPEAAAAVTDTPVLRMADTAVKARVLLEADAAGYHVCYRRVKRVNELVINDCVYADVEMLVETAHSLEARVGGHMFQVGFDGATQSYLRVDGETVAKKTRLW